VYKKVDAYVECAENSTKEFSKIDLRQTQGDKNEKFEGTQEKD